MEAFDHPNCPASYPTPSISHSNVAIEHVHNDALVYLAVAVATFAAVPSFLWLRDRRRRSRERRRNRVVVESIKAKLDAAKALEVVAQPVSIPVVEPSVLDEREERDAEDIRERKKRTKDRRKRNRDISRSTKNKRLSTSSGAPPAKRQPSPTEYTPRAPEQSHFSSPPMPDIASPMPVSLISTSFTSSSPSFSRSEVSSHPGHSRSASASSTTAPLTPPSLPPSCSLPHPLVKVNDAQTWALQLPHDDPAWDWDGQSSTYSSGSRAPSSSSRVRSLRQERLPSPPSPASPLMPSVPSLVFPSLNAHPPPGASLSTQIASLKGALEASRTREDMHRRDAERWSKECDLVKWRWNEASDLWRRREAELQTQIHHLMHQLQSITHTLQAASLSPSVAPLPFATGQPPLPLVMPFTSHHHPSSPFLSGVIHSFGHRSPSAAAPNMNESDVVNEELVEAILKRPSSIRTFTTPVTVSRGGVRCGEVSDESCARVQAEDDEARPVRSGSEGQDVVEFEFPTLLKRPTASPREMVGSVEIPN